ncbi:MAG: transcriptional regulator [Cyclobacteriaceae bacterium]|nr:transcriptional regulator [Cyclobacteriaceae bacterium]
MLFLVTSAGKGVSHMQRDDDFLGEQSVRLLKATRPDSAFYIVQSRYIEAQKHDDRRMLAYCALELGEILYYLGDLERANGFLIDAISFFEGGEDRYSLAEAYMWQGIVVQYARQLPLALNLYHKALDIYESSQDSIKMGELYGWIGHYYEKLGQPDTALTFQYKAKEMVSGKKNSELSLARIYDNIGSLYEDGGDYDSAFYYFKKSFAIHEQFREVNNMIVNLNNIGDIYRKRAQLDQSLIYTDSALNLAEKYNIDYQKRSAHRDFAKIYSSMGNYESAYEHLEQAYTIYSEILNEENSRRMSLLQAVYESERQESRIRLLEKDKHINQIFKLGLIGIIVILLSTAVFVVRSQHVKVRQGKKIIEQKTQIYAKEKDLNELELKNAVLKEEKLMAEINNQKFVEKELQKSLELKSQLITSQTLQIIRKNDFLEKLKHDLSRIKKGDKAERAEIINALKKAINQDINSDENWNDFNMIFSQVHKDFFTNIQNQIEDISPAELRLCSLLKLNLHSTEIATILGISIDSLRIARYRLRKKLGLKKNDSLVNFLINI